MLIQFRVENYKSFDEEQTLSLKAGTPRNNAEHITKINNIEILRTAAVFGANASGKSNLVKAMNAIRRFVITGNPLSKNAYCRIKDENASRPSSFEFTISIEDRIYTYGLEIMLSTGDIKSEWFNDLTKNSKSVSIFKRENNDVTTDLHLKKDRMYFDVYKNEAKFQTKVPFLLIMSRLPKNTEEGLDAIPKLYFWFINHLRIIGPGTPPNFVFTKRRNMFSGTILPSYGTGVSSITYEDLESEHNYFPRNIIDDIVRKSGHVKPSEEPFGIIENTQGAKFPVFMNNDGTPTVKKLMFDHNGVLYEYYEESDGTNRLYDLAPILDPMDEKDITYVIDELDRSLHPQVTQKFVKDFEKLDGKLKRQLITTTHESRLLDLGLLRRDEIWFVEKGNDGASLLFALEEFKERIDRSVDKAYLDGRYGAVPCFKKIFPELE